MLEYKHLFSIAAAEYAALPVTITGLDNGSLYGLHTVPVTTFPAKYASVMTKIVSRQNTPSKQFCPVGSLVHLTAGP
jgi:hypothetical protein